MDRFPDVVVVYPVHPNPIVRETAQEVLGGKERVHLLPPLDYVDLVDMMRRATLIVTDSGGIQEEAPSLGKPILVARKTTERPEGVEAGCAKLVGTDPKEIVKAASALLTDPAKYAAMAQPRESLWRRQGGGADSPGAGLSLRTEQSAAGGLRVTVRGSPVPGRRAKASAPRACIRPPEVTLTPSQTTQSISRVFAPMVTLLPRTTWGPRTAPGSMVQLSPMSAGGEQLGVRSAMDTFANS